MNNAEDEDTLYVGQPILLNIGIQNTLAQELIGIPELEIQTLQTQGVVVTRPNVTLCDQSRSWVSFIKVFIGSNEENVIWSGDLLSATNRVLRINQVDLNPVSVAEYIPPLDGLHGGQNQIWVVFDNTSLDAGTNPELRRLRTKSKAVALQILNPTNEHQRAWVLAEKGRMSKRQKQFDTAESLFKQAIKLDPMLERGPRVGTHRIFDLNWELADVYETTGHYSDAVRATTRTRDYAEKLPSSTRDEVLKQVDTRLSRLREMERPKH